MVSLESSLHPPSIKMEFFDIEQFLDKNLAVFPNWRAHCSLAKSAITEKWGETQPNKVRGIEVRSSANQDQSNISW